MASYFRKYILTSKWTPSRKWTVTEGSRKWMVNRGQGAQTTSLFGRVSKCSRWFFIECKQFCYRLENSKFIVWNCLSTKTESLKCLNVKNTNWICYQRSVFSALYHVWTIDKNHENVSRMFFRQMFTLQHVCWQKHKLIEYRLIFRTRESFNK